LKVKIEYGKNNRVTFKGLCHVLKESFKAFDESKVTKLSGSLSYNTIFSLEPLLIVIISLYVIFLGKEAIEGTIYQQLKGFVGTDSAKQLQDIIKNATISGKNRMT